MGDNEIELLGWQSFFEELQSFLISSGRHFDSANETYGNYVVERLETCIISLNALRENLGETAVSDVNGTLVRYKSDVEQLLSICRSLSVEWEQKVQEIEVTSDRHVYSYRAPVQVSSRRSRGRPRFSVSKEQLLYLSSLSFSWTDISHMLGISRMTVYRRRIEYGLSRDTSNNLSDEQLHTILREIKAGKPDLGEVIVMGQIHGLGYRVTRDRLRQALRRIDPLHTALRWGGGLTSRRPYNVRGPNSLWHIGNFSVQYQKNYPNLYFSTLHERLVSKKTAWCTLYTATFQLICSTSYTTVTLSKPLNYMCESYLQPTSPSP